MIKMLKGEPLIYVCSPYAGDPEGNSARAETYCRLVWERGGIPIAPHLLFTRFLDDAEPRERETGLSMGRRLLSLCSELWIFGDTVSRGMALEIVEASQRGIPVYHINEGG